MSKKKLLKFGNVKCHCVAGNPDRVLYMLFPMDQMDDICMAGAEHYNVSVVGITGMDWDDDMTPWPAPGAPSGCAPFQGKAGQFLDLLQNQIVPACEREMAIEHPTRYLLGVSLSGLFALWQWMVSDVFDDIASISGSFWYNGFTDWLSEEVHAKPGRAYFSLGDREEHTSVPQFKSVAEDTRQVVSLLQEAGIDTEFRIVPGNHYQYALQRMEWALDWLLRP